MTHNEELVERAGAKFTARMVAAVEQARPLCPDHRDKQHGKTCLACRIEELERACRNARACLLNLQPEERNPMQVQMQKMIHELSLVLDR